MVAASGNLLAAQDRERTLRDDLASAEMRHQHEIEPLHISLKMAEKARVALDEQCKHAAEQLVAATVAHSKEIALLSGEASEVNAE